MPAARALCCTFLAAGDQVVDAGKDQPGGGAIDKSIKGADHDVTHARLGVVARADRSNDLQDAELYPDQARFVMPTMRNESAQKAPEVAAKAFAFSVITSFLLVVPN